MMKKILCIFPMLMLVMAACGCANEQTAVKTIEENKRLVQKFIEDHIPEMSIVQSEATYLVWIDCQSITKSSREFCERLKTKFGVYLASGDSYGKCGDVFLRMHIACSKQQLLQGLERRS